MKILTLVLTFIGLETIGMDGMLIVLSWAVLAIFGIALFGIALFGEFIINPIRQANEQTKSPKA